MKPFQKRDAFGDEKALVIQDPTAGTWIHGIVTFPVVFLIAWSSTYLPPWMQSKGSEHVAVTCIAALITIVIRSQYRNILRYDSQGLSKRNVFFGNQSISWNEIRHFHIRSFDHSGNVIYVFFDQKERPVFEFEISRGSVKANGELIEDFNERLESRLTVLNATDLSKNERQVGIDTLKQLERISLEDSPLQWYPYWDTLLTAPALAALGIAVAFQVALGDKIALGWWYLLVIPICVLVAWEGSDRATVGSDYIRLRKPGMIRDIYWKDVTHMELVGSRIQIRYRSHEKGGREQLLKLGLPTSKISQLMTSTCAAKAEQLGVTFDITWTERDFKKRIWKRERGG